MEKIINLGASAQEDVVYESPTRSVTRQEFKVQRTKDIKTGERLTLAEASIVVNAQQIALKASESSLNALGVRVTTAEATIVVQAGQIALKATQTDLNATNGRVTTAEGTIVVHTGQIALKASQSSLDALGGRVTTAESSIVIHTGQIALKVNTTDLNNTLTSYSTITQTDTKIALEIGTVRQAGANLVLYTQQDFEQGLIDLSNGAESPSANGLRTAEFTTILPSTDYLLEASGTGIDVANTFIVLYTATNVFSRYFAFSGGNRKITTLATEVKFKVRFQKTPLATLLITEMPNFKVSVSLINKYLTGTKYVFDGTGAVFSGGGLTIKNNAGTQVFGADVNGNLDIVGKITASSGDIGGFDILSDRITAGSGTTRVGMSPSVLVSGYYYVFWAGNDSPYSAPFRVQRNGAVSMSSATIGGWTVSSSAIYKGDIKLDATNERIYVGSTAYLYSSNGTSQIGINGSLYISGGLTFNGSFYAIFGGSQYLITRDSSGYLRAL